MSTTKRKPPSAIRRKLRKESGFGCCFCGHPFIQYHHIIDWAVVKRHNPKDMMVVCPNCHNKCTHRGFSEAEQRQAKRSPKNIVDGLASGQLVVNSSKLYIEIGGNKALDYRDIITAGPQHIPMLSARKVTGGRILISAIIQDEYGGVIGQIINNEWTSYTNQVWDIEAAHRRVSIKTDSGRIAFEADCRKDTLCLKGKWYCGKSRVVFTPSKIIVNGLTITNSVIRAESMFHINSDGSGGI